MMSLINLPSESIANIPDSPFIDDDFTFFDDDLHLQGIGNVGQRITDRDPGSVFIRGKSTPCITCHGEDLMGQGDSPPIAGRSPSYMVRQIWDI